MEKKVIVILFKYFIRLPELLFGIESRLCTSIFIQYEKDFISQHNLCTAIYKIKY